MNYGRILCFFLLLPFLSLSLEAQDTGQEYLPLADARIVRVSDDNAFVHRDETNIPLEVDMIVEEGDWIHSMDGTVVITFANGSNLVMQRQAVIYLAELRQEPYDADALGAYGALQADPSRSVTRVFLSEGEVRGHTRSLRSDSVFRVSTPVGAAGIRGTRFAVSLSLDGDRLTLNVRNYGGTVILERTFIDSAGQTAVDEIGLV
ncbi:MAG: FecR domain-containing protein, partial [Opitutales bacterium]|nr:FecR domain-containing protein [Opitutales bacterium]